MMRFLPWFALAVALASSAAEARPRDGVRATVEIEWGWRAQDHIIVGQQVWRCEESRCSGSIASDAAALRRRACRAIARRGHRVLRFETASGQLGEAELAACNGEGG